VASITVGISLTNLVTTVKLVMMTLLKVRRYNNFFQHFYVFSFGLHVFCEAGSSVCTVSDCELGFNPQQRHGIFSVASVPRLPVGPTQPSVQWVPGSSPWG
jgi:hypothetical protein